MRKTIVLLLLLQAGAVVKAQIQVKDFINGQAMGVDISRTTVAVTTTTDTSFLKSFYVENASGTAMDLGIQRLRLSGVDCWHDALTWAPFPDPNFEGMCFGFSQMPTNPWTTMNTPVIPAAAGAVFEANIETYHQGCTDYRYRVMNGGIVLDSIDLHVCSTVSTYCLPAATDENVLKSGLEIYPNPSRENVYFSVVEPCDIVIYDLSGKEMNAFRVTDNYVFNTSGFESGTYLVSISKKGAVTESRKMVKQ